MSEPEEARPRAYVCRVCGSAVLDDEHLPGDVLSHRVTIRLHYANEGRTPWKWEGKCTCGWKVLSWQWQRANGSGALPVSLEHVGLRHIPSPPHCYEEEA